MSSSDAINWRTHEVTAKTDAPFYLQSEFGSLFNLKAESVEKQNSYICGIQSNPYEKNPIYSKKICSYLRIKILPYCVFMTKIPYRAAKHPITSDENNAVEYWMKILKNDILEKARYQKMSRVIRAQADNVLGNNVK